jgi:excisionase family DNA binding protein
MTEASIAPPQLLTVDEVAAVLHVSRSHAYLLVHSGKLASVRIGRSVRVRPETLEVFIAEREGDGAP